MPIAICRHIRSNGTRCRAFALRNRALCYHHETVNAHLRTLRPPDDGTQNLNHPLTRDKFLREPLLADYFANTRAPLQLNLPVLEDANAIQLALSMVLTALGQDRIDLKRAAAILYTLQTAAINVRQLPKEECNTVQDFVTDETGTILALEVPEKDEAGPEDADAEDADFDAEIEAEIQADNEAWLQQQAEEKAREAAWQQAQAQKRAQADAAANTTTLCLTAAADPATPSTPYSLFPIPYSLTLSPHRTPFVRHRTSDLLEGLALRAATLKEHEKHHEHPEHLQVRRRRRDAGSSSLPQRRGAGTQPDHRRPRRAIGRCHRPGP